MSGFVSGWVDGFEWIGGVLSEFVSGWLCGWVGEFFAE